MKQKFHLAKDQHEENLPQNIYSIVVQFYPWFNFYFPCFVLIVTHYHTQKQRKINLNQAEELLTRILQITVSCDKI